MTHQITVRGMSCEGCEETVESALAGVDGVTAATADRETETATVEGDADLEVLVQAVRNAGYDASS